ncbi:aegerolysin type hemolysin [Trichoderma barbatum]
MSEVSTNDKSQWASMRVHNRMKKNTISFKNASLKWGKFWKGSHDNEISASEVDKIVVSPGSMESADSAGRTGSSAGCAGSLDLYDGDTKICGIYWSSPYWETDNTFGLTSYDVTSSPYSVTVGDWNRSGGALGDVDITVAMLAAE